jgi:hypothetical protein
MLKTAIGRAMFVVAASAPSAEAAAQASVNGPYYATPSWDQTLPASSRFLVLANFNNQAVLDRETGLVWARAATPRVPYVEAYNECAHSSVGGRMGWRLPALNEMSSLVDPAAASMPPLPTGHPFTGLNGDSFDRVWSSTADVAGLHWTITYSMLGSDPLRIVVKVTQDTDTNTKALCVRSPGPIDPTR